MRAAVALLWLAALGPTPFAPHRELGGEAGSGRWVQVTPFAPDQPDKLLAVADGAQAAAPAGLKPGLAMVCAGGPKAATLCERRLIGDNSSITFAGPVPGVHVTGGVRIGRRPAVGAQIAFVPEPLRMRRPFSVPLYRDGDKLVSRVTADARGRFAAPLLAPGTYRLDVRIAGGRIVQGEPITVPEPRRLRRKPDPPDVVPGLDVGELVVEDGVELAVTVTDSAGRLLARAGVGAIQSPEPGKDVFFEARSDESGVARLASLDPAQPVGVTCVAHGYARYEEHFTAPPAALHCALASLGSIAGKVVDDGGRPLPGAMVSERRGGRGSRTGVSGAFVLEELRPGDHSLTVAAPGFKAARRDVALAAGERRQLEPIELTPAGSLAGTVVDGVRNEPVAGAVVTIADPPGFTAVTTGLDGGFVLSAGSDAGLRLEVTAEGYPVTAVAVPAERLAAEEPLRIDLYPGGRVKATVWDEDADAPCLGCSVVLVASGGTPQSLTTDAAGEALSPLLPKGPCTATLEVVESSGSVVHVHGGENVRRLSIEPGKVTPVSFGEKLPVLVVRFSSPLPAGWSLRADGASSLLTVKPRDDGSFAVRRRPSEPVRLSLVGPAGLVIREAALPAAAGDATLDLPLSESRVGGTLLRGQEAAPFTRVSLLGADGAEAARAVTDEAGVFLIPYLPPGNYTLVIGTAAGRGFALAPGMALDLGAVHGPDTAAGGS